MKKNATPATNVANVTPVIFIVHTRLNERIILIAASIKVRIIIFLKSFFNSHLINIGVLKMNK